MASAVSTLTTYTTAVRAISLSSTTAIKLNAIAPIMIDVDFIKVMRKVAVMRVSSPKMRFILEKIAAQALISLSTLSAVCKPRRNIFTARMQMEF